MKKEIRDIILAAKAAERLGQKVILATVVHVEGSSYRRPGARMLVSEDGKLTGAISGGCLEGDALRKALLALQEGKNKLVTYDTSDEDDAKVGVQLGCNGIVQILFEPIDYSRPQNPITFLSRIIEKRIKGVLVTAFNPTDKNGFHPGTCGLYTDEGTYFVQNLSKTVLPQIQSQITHTFRNECSTNSTFHYANESFHCFLEYVTPPVSLVILGAGNDVIPLVDMAASLGWSSSVFDGRPAYASATRFKNAKEVFVARPAEVLQHLNADDFNVYVLMSHNYNYDLAMLELLLPLNTKYIGVLGPKKKLEKMLSELKEKGVQLTEHYSSKLFGPVGLDIGAESAEEIALSILSEIKVVLSQRRSVHLRDKTSPIHDTKPENSGISLTPGSPV